MISSTNLHPRLPSFRSPLPLFLTFIPLLTLALVFPAESPTLASPQRPDDRKTQRTTPTCTPPNSHTSTLLLPARFWADGIASNPRTPMAGDADGDGRADVLVFYPSGEGIVDYARTSALGKPCFPVQARTHFGKDGLTAVCGSFLGTKQAEVLAVFADGSVRMASGMAAGNHTFSRDDLATAIPADLIPHPPVRAVAGDFDGDHRVDVLLIGGDNRLLLLQNQGMKSGAVSFAVRPVVTRIPVIQQATAGDLDGHGRAEFIWSEDTGSVYRAGLRIRRDGPVTLGHRIRVLSASCEDRLAVGHFRNAKTADLLVGQQLLPRGRAHGRVFLPTLPGAADSKGDLAWIAGDFTGSGLDDLLRVRRSGERFVGDDLLLHFNGQGSMADGRWSRVNGQGSMADGRWSMVDGQRSMVNGQSAADGESVVPLTNREVQPFDSTGIDRRPQAPLAIDHRPFSFDGLPSEWKIGEIKPGGLDLASMGCSPAHYDVIVEVQRIETVPETRLHSEMDRVVKYYASLPVENPDGSTGIALHVIYREPIPAAEASKGWGELGEKYHPASHRGITHWVVVTGGGGGQSGQMADRGGCGIAALYATFIHEFGHQLGLDHTGFWGPAWCPTYPSLMNYAYSYQRGGDPKAIGYSDGRLASVVLNEKHLSERLPLPPEKLAFLAGPPYHYRMKPTPDGKGTLIDWNWNGIFGEEDVAADINYGYSTTAGLRHTIGKLYTAPALAALGSGKNERLLLFFGRLPDGAPRPTADAAAKQPSLSPENPGRLRMRVWQGTDPAADGDRWSDEKDLESSEVTGDPSTCALNGAAWVAYSTITGVKLRRVSLDASGMPTTGDAIPVPDSTGCQPTLTLLGDRLALLLWRDREKPVGIRLLKADESKITFEKEETPLPFSSNGPVGAAAGSDEGAGPSLWIGLSQDQDEKRHSRWQVRRLALDKNGAWQQVEQEWLGGERGGERGPGRVMLLREENKAFGPQGQLYFFGCGEFGKETPWSCHYVVTRIADKTVNGGWLTRRYYDEWTQSRSAPGVCFFKGDIAFAARWFGDVHGWDNDNLFVAFYGRGIESEPMGDFDDIGLIRDVGMSHSIPYVTE